ncbi:hypothetical protein ANANG_G00060710 [Anguilla anguilla]|uniref:Trafficking protein, kinesin binding 2 n=1 Tax=Anguilla anguilla TaxID=7936 RepID=A0A9D3MNW7_ANGAN|nr:hypothetical protein ANANG_G00060710 [Anguilla anguilla]
MFEVKPMSVEKEPAPCPDEGHKDCGSGPAHVELRGSDGESLYLYDSQDWALSPSCSPEESSAVSPMLAEETFRYMTYLALEPSSYSHPGSHCLSQVLSGDRVDQMTKTYNDVDVVTHLLAERDRDLELAARIGQSLLQRNHLLQERNESVEEQLAEALDRVHQLQHELSKKDELLRMVASASEESETDSSCSTPLRHSQSLGAALALSQLEALQSKLQELEEENLALRSEATHLKTETITYEEKEQQLVSDCVKELRETNSQMVALTDELSRKNEEVLRHQEEMAQLLAQIVDLQHRVKELALEKEELRIHLQASKDAQRQLTAELNELQDRNAECVGMLHESQEEVRELRNKCTPSAGLRRHLPYGLLPMDSLAAEIEGTMRRELSLEEESTMQEQKSAQQRVFQTVRSINESARPHLPPRPIPGSARSSVVMTAQPFLSQTPGGAESSEGASKQGARPEQPGSREEVTSSRRCTASRCGGRTSCASGSSSRRSGTGSCRPRPGTGPRRTGRGATAAPRGSAFSSFSNFSELSGASGCFKTYLPEKLQIVKPMEGSLTLHHWQQLAQPHLATILDPHPGVVTKGFRPLPQDAVYHLTDLEEDEEEAAVRRGTARLRNEEARKRRKRREGSPSSSRPPSPARRASPPLPGPLGRPASSAPFPPVSQILSTPASSSAQNPGKCLSSTFSTYTFTTCRILHPSAVTQVTSSSMSCPSVSVRENTPSSLRPGPSTPVTPCRLSLGDSFPRRPAAPAGWPGCCWRRASPPRPKPPARPGTPPNSPSCSPAASPLPFETRPASADNFLASRPAELFLQEVPGRVSVNLVEQVRRLGFAKVLQGAESDGLRRQDSATFLATGGGSLLDGLRRNQSLPAMVGGAGPVHLQSLSSGPAPSPDHSLPPHSLLGQPEGSKLHPHLFRLPVTSPAAPTQSLRSSLERRDWRVIE